MFEVLYLQLRSWPFICKVEAIFKITNSSVCLELVKSPGNHIAAALLMGWVY
jgi:hypothetical protein